MHHLGATIQIPSTTPAPVSIIRWSNSKHARWSQPARSPNRTTPNQPNLSELCLENVTTQDYYESHDRQNPSARKRLSQLWRASRESSHTCRKERTILTPSWKPRPTNTTAESPANFCRCPICCCGRSTAQNLRLPVPDSIGIFAYYYNPWEEKFCWC